MSAAFETKKHLARLSIILLIVASTACRQVVGVNIPISGADKDDHGCTGTAGYNWSKLKNDCIRLWETGTALDNARDKKAGTVAYIVIADDNKTVELFLPDSTMSILLRGNGVNWLDADNRYSLTRSIDSSYQLHNNKGILLYQNQP